MDESPRPCQHASAPRWPKDHSIGILRPRDSPPHGNASNPRARFGGPAMTRKKGGGRCKSECPKGDGTCSKQRHGRGTYRTEADLYHDGTCGHFWKRGGYLGNVLIGGGRESGVLET